MRTYKMRGMRRINRGCGCASERTVTGQRRRWHDADGGRKVMSLEARSDCDAYGGQRRDYRQPLKITPWY